MSQDAVPSDKGWITSSLKYPISDGWNPILVAGGLTLISFLIIPWIIVQGYSFRVGRRVAEGESMPSFKDWAGLLIDGLRFFALGLIFATVVSVVASLGVFAGDEGTLLGTVFGLISVYVLPAVVVSFVGKNNIIEALTSSETYKYAFSLEYLIMIGYLIILIFPILIIFVLGAVTVIGYIFVAPYITMVTFAFYGLAYRKSGSFSPDRDVSI
jgi:hypothetical protein